MSQKVKMQGGKLFDKYQHFLISSLIPNRVHCSRDETLNLSFMKVNGWSKLMAQIFCSTRRPVDLFYSSILLDLQMIWANIEQDGTKNITKILIAWTDVL